MNVSQELATYDLMKDEVYMSEQMRAYFKHILERWKKNIQEGNSREPDPVDAGAREGDWETIAVLLEHRETILREIEESLSRLQKGTYGYSEESGQPIGRERLKAWPIARVTALEQQQREKLTA